MKLTVDGRSVRFTEHAVVRYGERACRFDQWPDVVGELLAVTASAAWGPEPAWAEAAPGADAWLFVGDDIVFPVVNGYAVTCLTRGGIGEKMRDYRRQKRQKHARAGVDRRGVVKRRGEPRKRWV